jgi:hypothetical protein
MRVRGENFTMDDDVLRARARRREQRAREREAAARARQAEALEAAAGTSDPEIRDRRLAEAKVHARAARLQHNSSLAQDAHAREHSG